MYRNLSPLYLCSSILSAAIWLTGCVTPIPLAQEAPNLSYKATRPIVVAVVDERNVLAQGKPPTYIGRAHGLFGIPSDMQTYPWFVSDKSKKSQTLAQALEERIVAGLNDEGWQLFAASYAKRPTKDEAVTLLAAHSAERLLLLSITKWFVRININWVTAFNFEWGYKLEVLDEQGIAVASIMDSGRDVVDEEAKQSPQNTIKMAYRERLIKILEQPDLINALNQSRIMGNMYFPPKHQTAKAASAVQSPHSNSGPARRQVNPDCKDQARKESGLYDATKKKPDCNQHDHSSTHVVISSKGDFKQVATKKVYLDDYELITTKVTKHRDTTPIVIGSRRE